MENLSKVKELIIEYSEKYRNPNLSKYKVSDLYDLFPNEKTVHEVKHKWPDVWPFCSSAGVYIILDIDLNILYIGKASHFGYRLGSYFMYDENKNCMLKDSWKGNPRFVVTIAVPDDSKFECSSLEEFLILKIKPNNNTRGL